MHILKIRQPVRNALPPIHMWPMALKEIIAALAAMLCFATYALLAGGLLLIGLALAFK